MGKLLIIPVRVDALVLPEDRAVASPSADFRQLPFFDGTRDVRSSAPFLSETILSQPFEAGNLWLGRGLHLHWTLPASLTRADENGVFPPVPNRWLVVLSGGGLTEAQSFVVESDAISAEELDAQQAAVLFPYQPGPPPDSPLPYRSLGRKVPLAAWSPGAATYLASGALTAVGYGEPNFAGFYPNCYSVFGLQTSALDLTQTIQVEVFGWYSDASLDPLASLVRSPPPPPSNTCPEDALRQAIQSELELFVPSDTNPCDLLAMVCHARLSIQPKPASESPSAGEIAVGNTGIEALSAFLASKLAGTSTTPETSSTSLPSKTQIENQLLSLLLSSQWQQRQVDRGAAFEQARHAKEIHAASGPGAALESDGDTTSLRWTSGGTVWVVKPPAEPPPGRGKTGAAPSPPELPPTLGTALNHLNKQQAVYDRADNDIRSLREQLFADWYRYLQSSYPVEGLPNDYPDIDEVRFFIEHQSLRQVEALVAARGTLAVVADAKGRLSATVSQAAGGQPTWAGKVADAINTLQAELDNYNGASPSPPSTLLLKPGAAPRYWEPNDPVLLLSGDALRGTGRLGETGDLTCLSVDAPGPLVTPAALATLQQSVQIALGNAPFPAWSPPWNPFLFEWEVEYFTAEGLRKSGQGGYSEGALSELYALHETAVDLSPTAVSYRKGATLYTGRSQFTPHAIDHLVTVIELYLVGAFCDVKGLTRPPRSGLQAFIAKNASALVEPDEYVDANKKTPSWLSADFLTTLIGAYQALQQESFYAVTQSLGGFHAALTQRRQVHQLPIADPLGFDDAQAFALRVRAALTISEGQTENKTAPEPFDDFNPIRAGAMEVLRLRLIDTFGQMRELAWSAVTTASTLTLPDAKGRPLAALPPRICQPARLSLRFLSAAHEHHVEMNSHPATSPLCGWLVPNYLDQSLLIYDGQGKGLGFLNPTGAFGAMPGSTDDSGISGISNLHLRGMVSWLQRKTQGDASFLPAFLSTLDSALGNIQPEGAEQHMGLALLMGRPMALVRTAIQLELMGLPRVDQSFASLRMDLRSTRRNTNGFERVRFPVRLGEHGLFGDGLVGYWQESDRGMLGDSFYSPASAALPSPSPSIVTPQPGKPMNLSLSASDEPLLLSLLMDPRGALHATSGILPTKVISIPPDQYAAALRAIEISFLSAPLLTDIDKTRVSLPTEPGYQWSWLEMRGASWRETPSLPTANPRVHAFQTQATFAGENKLQDGWLALKKAKDASK